MAEYLLKGGKMLDKSCPSCGSPLFQIKGDTICVVCGGARKPAPAPDGEPAIEESGEVPVDIVVEQAYPDEEPGMSGDLRAEVEKTIVHLCRKVREESRPKDCLVLMECIKIADDVLKGR